jgi:hypothetical protein
MISLPEPEQILAFRLQRHGLTERRPADDLLALAAELPFLNSPPGTAGLALGARLEGLNPARLDEALLGSRALLQAWSLRATPAVFATAAAGVYTAGLLPPDEPALLRFVRGAEPALKKLKLTASELVAWVADALPGILAGRHQTKDELGVALAAGLEARLAPGQLRSWRGRSPYSRSQTLGESLARFALPVTALQGLICHAERKGAQARLALTAEWLPEPPPALPPELARAELARRYLALAGPSTTGRFAEWAGIAPQQATAAFAALAGECVELRQGRKKALLLARDLAALAAAQPAEGVRFLPPHDPLLDLRDRDVLAPNPAHRQALWKGQTSPGALLVDGSLAGTWSATKAGSRLKLSVQAFRPYPHGLRAVIEAEAERVAALRGCQRLELSYRM